jgi:hypothetical protein
MKKFFLLVCVSCLSVALNAQLFKTGEAEFNGITYPAYIKEVEVAPNNAIDAIKEMFYNRGVPGPKNIKGWLVYRNVALPSTGTTSPQDLFVKVDRAGKKNEERSLISLIITKPGVISDQKPPKGTKAVPIGFALGTGGGAVFEEVTPALENKVYLQSVLKQEKEVQNAEKRLQYLNSEQEKMMKSLEKLQSDIEKNKADIEAQMKTVESTKGELEKVKNTKPTRN